MTSSLCFTTDLWTSKSMKSFMAVTYHYIDNDFQCVSGLLDFVPIKGRHFGERLALSLIHVFEDYGISKSQVLTITVDNASNNDTMMKTLITKGYLRNGEHHIRCFAHILNLTAQDLLGFISEIIKQIRVNNKFIRGSDPRLESFENCCNFTKVIYNKPQLDSKTRWNSTYDMLKIDMKLRPAIDLFIQQQGKDVGFDEEIMDELEEVYEKISHNAAVLSDTDWDMVIFY